jgi:Xaa-Pro dipeptidase
MNMNKRSFLKAGGASIAALSVSTSAFASSTKESQSNSQVLKDITKDIAGITSAEREARIIKAQQLMQQMNISALIIEPGAAMDYFSGIQWWRSERLTALVIPQQGKVAVVCPFFEEPSIQESLAIDGDIRVWQEHESPFERIKQILADRGISLTKGTIGFENSVRYFVQHGVMSLLSTLQHVSAEPVTRGCRMFKSHHELQLMHKANEVTLLAYSEVYSKLEVGMTSAQVKSLMSNAQATLGGKGAWNMALIDQASAFPHGSKKKHLIKEGSIVLMDCGCNVHGYQSDISRTFVVGEPTNRQRDVWQTVRTGQKIAFEQAQIGNAAGTVDDAVRKYYQAQGFGPDYKLPGLSHRTGHGIGMEGHESVNFVHGEQEKLTVGMCFSNEPGIYIPGEFGVRLEDCIYMTDKGPQWFTIPPDSLDSPLGKLAKFT